MAGNPGGGGVLEPILGLFKEKPKLKQLQFDLYKPEADYYRRRADELESMLETDRATSARATERFEAGLPGLERSAAQDIDFIEALRPGGTQEQRFAGLIQQYMGKAREAAKTGLETSRARQSATEALGGNAPFAQSSLRNRQRDLIESNFERALAEREGGMQLENALRFLQSYRPGGRLGLASAMNMYRLSPLEFRRQSDALSAARAAAATQGLRSAIDTHYTWKKKNNWADYLSALGATGANVLNTALEVYGAVGGGLGGMGGGGGGGAAANPYARGGALGGYGYGGGNDYLGGI